MPAALAVASYILEPENILMIIWSVTFFLQLRNLRLRFLNDFFKVKPPQKVMAELGSAPRASWWSETFHFFYIVFHAKNTKVLNKYNSDLKYSRTNSRAPGSIDPKFQQIQNLPKFQGRFSSCKPGFADLVGIGKWGRVGWQRQTKGSRKAWFCQWRHYRNNKCLLREGGFF